MAKKVTLSEAFSSYCTYICE